MAWVGIHAYGCEKAPLARFSPFHRGFNPPFSRSTGKALERIGQDKEVQNKLDYDQMDWLSYRNGMKAEGSDTRAKEIASRQIKRGTNTLAEIAEDTGLTLKEVEKLAEVAMA